VHYVRPAVYFILALTLSACKTGAPSMPTGPLDQRVVLAPGGTAVVSGANTVVKFEGVFSDSRCPGDAICVWAGDATVRLSAATSGDATSSYELHTMDQKPLVRHRDLTIALEALSPYPFSSLGPIKPGDYRATLRITR
jgi:hypothetical protein